MIDECDNYLDGFCIKDLDAGRCWDCTAPNKEARVREAEKGWYIPGCPYPKLSKD
jgi:hypothetical protein